jgi:hypothetical protein
MRFRLQAKLGDAIEQLARAEGRTPQNMAARLLFKGLAAQGHPVQPVTPIDESDKGDLHIPLPGPAFRKIKELAAAQLRSNRSMTRQIILAGLQTYGATPPAVTDAPVDTVATRNAD